MSTKQTKILLIEDNAGDIRLIQEMLNEVTDASWKLKSANRLSTGLQHLAKEQFDVVLLDLGLPDSQGLDTLSKTYAKTEIVPILVLTGLDDESVAIESVNHGAQDYLIKGQINGPALWRTIRYAIGRKRLEEALRNSEERYRLLVDNASEAIIVAQDGMIKFANPKATELSGYSKEELTSVPFVEIIHPDDREMVFERYLRRLQGEEIPSTYPFRIIDKKGNIKWAEIHAVALTWDGKPATLNLLTDITERKKMEEQKLVTAKLASVGELAAGVAHEINNPLTAVLGYSELLASKHDIPQDIKHDVEVIYQESQRAVRIVQNLLRFARSYKPERILLDINELIKRTVELEAYRLKTSNIVLSMKLANDLPLILADYNQLQQIILNIITNSQQAIDETKRKGKITVITDTAGDYVRISIADNGPGIAPENINKIFDPFFTTKPVGSGSGLGLSVCHGFITEHGGKIYAESNSGKGTIFTIELPTAIEEQAAMIVEETVEETDQQPRQKKAGNILIVEDESAIRISLTRTLLDEGYNVQAVSHGRAALDNMAENFYDLLLFDIKMPGMTGIELYETTKKKYPNLAERVVFITGDTMTASTNKFLAKTDRPYLIKPFDSKDVINIIEKTLGDS